MVAYFCAPILSVLMKAILFACLALPFSVSVTYSLSNSYISSVANRYDIQEVECSSMQPDENLIFSNISAFDKCATLCDEYAECLSFQWNETLCQTYNFICHNLTSANFTYLLTKRERTDPKVIFSSTYFLRMFGACRSNDSTLPNNMSISTIEDCANNCAKYPHCQYASFSHESQPNCRIGENFCDNPNERIQRGNHHWQLLKRINCTDNNVNCPFWKSTGECEKNPTWMSTNCAASCTDCAKGNVNSVGICADQNTQCRNWQEAGECNSNPSYMNSYCRVSCGLCGSVNKTVYKLFEGVKFARSNELCGDRKLIKSVVNITECAKLCISLNDNCSSFIWYANISGGCYIQPRSCSPRNETHLNYTIFKKLPMTDTKVSSMELSELQKHSVAFGIAIVAAFIVTLGLIVLIFINWRKYKQQKELTYLDRDLKDPTKEIDPIVPVFEQLENLKLDGKFELPLDRIDVDRKHLKTLGMGNFGRVVLGNYKLPDGNSVSVAIKRTRSSWDAEQYRMLFKEICLMANIGKHPNLVNLVGAVTQIAKGHLYLVMDYCSNGSLREFIINSVEENQFHNEIVSNGSEEIYAIKPVETNQLCTSDLLSFAFQIASGMEYVASVKLVHRDLATRNVLLTSDLIAKISDFGLGRQEYQFYETDKTVLLPIRWTSPEALLLHKFSTRSDVWSFGVTLGEIFSLGTVPFANVSKFDRSFAQDLKEGRLIVPKPQYSPERVYKLITHCCMPDPKNRVSFAQCKDLLLDEFRFCNAAKFEQLTERLLDIQKSFSNGENSEISTDPTSPAVSESSSKRPSFFRFLSQKSSADQKGLADLMSTEFQRQNVELNTYQ